MTDAEKNGKKRLSLDEEVNMNKGTLATTATARSVEGSLVPVETNVEKEEGNDNKRYCIR